jgi:hypothetical protein
MQGDPFGVSFSPSAGPTGDGGSKPTPVQQAIQTLSLKIPKNPGAGAIAPGALLNSPGGGAVGGNPNDAMILEQIRKMLFGTKPGQVGMGPQMPTAPDMGSQPSVPPPPQGGGFGPGPIGTGAPMPKAAMQQPGVGFKSLAAMYQPFQSPSPQAPTPPPAPPQAPAPPPPQAPAPSFLAILEQLLNPGQASAPPPNTPQFAPRFTPVEGTGAPGQPPPPQTDTVPYGDDGIGFEDPGEGLQRVWRG